MYWLYGAYVTSIVLILLIEITKKYGVNKNGIQEYFYYNPLFVFLYACPLIYVAACRYSFWDTYDYRLMYEAVGKSFDNVFNNVTGNVEKGYLLFTALLNRISHDSQLLIIVSSVFIIGLICYFLYKESTDLAMTFLIFSSQIWMSTMNGLRQYMVAAVLWIAWRKWSKSKQCLKNDIFFILAVILMASFHKSVLICIPMFFFARGKLWNRKVILCMLAAVAMIFVPPLYNLVFNFLLGGTEYSNYIDTSATMGISRFIICCFPVALMCCYYYLYSRSDDNPSKVMIWMMNLSSLNFACNILALRMVYFARIGMYFSIFDLIVIPFCIDKCFSIDSRRVIKFLLFVFYIYFFYKQMIAYGSFAADFQLFYEVK